MDRASYNMICEADSLCQTSVWHKIEIKQWLENKNIDFDSNNLKPSLLEITKTHKPEGMCTNEVQGDLHVYYVVVQKLKPDGRTR